MLPGTVDTDICRSVATDLAKAIGRVPKNATDFYRNIGKKFCTGIVGESLQNLGNQFGMETIPDHRVSGCKPPKLVREYDSTWTLDGTLHLAAESEWYVYKVSKVTEDFEKLLYANTQTKLLIHRLPVSEAVPAIVDVLAGYRHHVAGEDYILVQATDYRGFTTGLRFRIPETDGTLRRKQIDFRPVAGSPFEWRW
jgi:hypothetical protein